MGALNMVARWQNLRPHALHPGAIQGKEGIKFCHLATMFRAPMTIFLPSSSILAQIFGSPARRPPGRFYKVGKILEEPKTYNNLRAFHTLGLLSGKEVYNPKVAPC